MKTERFSINRTVFQKTELYSWVMKKADKIREEKKRRDKTGKEKACFSLLLSLEKTSGSAAETGEKFNECYY